MPDYRGLKLRPIRFGVVSLDDLFNDNEQAIFDFYKANKGRYTKALDIGANVGIHSILMAREGWKVLAFEPDPLHFEHLVSNIKENPTDGVVSPYQAAVSSRSGTATFVSVTMNSTGSHLEGDKRSYGPTQRFQVNLVDCRTIFEWADFAKVDCEGHEAELLTTVSNDKCEFMVEIGNLRNAERIFGHFHSLAIGMWAQKSGWKRVEALGDMPSHHSHGMLFIGRERPHKG